MANASALFLHFHTTMPLLQAFHTAGSLEDRPDVVVNVLIIVLLLPPAPAARVLAGLLAAALSARSAAAFRRIAVFGPPGGVGDEGRAVLEPIDCGGLTGGFGFGDDLA